MQKNLTAWIKILCGPFLAVISFFFRAYSANRSRVENLKANEKISSLIEFMAIAILLGWFLIWFSAPEEDPTILLDDVKQSIGGLKSSSDQ